MSLIALLAHHKTHLIHTDASILEHHLTEASLNYIQLASLVGLGPFKGSPDKSGGSSDD